MVGWVKYIHPIANVNQLTNKVMKTNYITKNEIRRLFFETYPQFKHEYKARKSQNLYSCDCRCTFVDFVDYIMKDSQISERMANNITLG